MEESQDFEQKQEENIDHSQLVEKSQMEINEEKEEQKNKIVEESPKGRFKRLNDTLGRGAFKTVYRAIDIDTGNEVAWNVIQVRDLKSKDKRRVIQEIEIIKSLNHENLIRFISAWHNTKTQEVVIITEMITGGSLKTHLKRVKSPKLKVIKSYCKMILKGLEYLHNQSSPIIHRDLKCDNIFINSNNGQIFIGDLGLSTSMQTNYNKTVLGTPEFMAPELYEEHYDTSVDIWAFGMTVIEMTTNCTPYSECENFAQVYRKIMDRTPPEALNKIKDEQLKKFIQKCLTEPQNRPNASALLQDE